MFWTVSKDYLHFLRRDSLSDAIESIDIVNKSVYKYVLKHVIISSLNFKKVISFCLNNVYNVYNVIQY